MNNSFSSLIAKMELYRMVALAFHFPEKSQFDELKDDKFIEILNDALNATANNSILKGTETLNENLSLREKSFEEFESDYLSDFEINMPHASCSLYERHYVKDERFTTILLELKAFYKNFDLTKSSEFDDSEDHIVFELEFMYFLLFKELQAIKSGTDKDPYLRCRSDFLERHLLKWIPEFIKKVDKDVNSKFHRHMAKILGNLVEMDYSEIKENVVIN